MSSIQITEQDNFIKINVRENVPFNEYSRFLKEFDKSLYLKISNSVALYDTSSCVVDRVLSKIIYVFCSNNSCYAISSNKGKTLINKRTIYDEKNPNTEEFSSGLVEINDFDKAFHISDETIYLNLEEKEYGLQNWRHGLYHGSTVDGISFNSKSYFEKTLQFKDTLLEMAQKLIEEIKNIENIETILDLSIFEIIPAPDSKKLIKQKNDTSY